MSGDAGPEAVVPGGRKSTAAKKRRLDALHEQNQTKKQKRGQDTSGGESDKYKYSAQSNTISSVYMELGSNLLSGPAAEGLKLVRGGVDPQKRLSEVVNKLAATESQNLGSWFDNSVKTAMGNKAFLNLSNESIGKANAVMKRQQRRNKSTLISNAARKRAGLSPLHTGVSVQAVEQLHKLWQEFMAELWIDNAGVLLAPRGMILQGCQLKVVQAANPLHIGKEGVVVQHSAAFVHLADMSGSSSGPGTEDAGKMARMYSVPKKGTHFTFVLKCRWGCNTLITVKGSKL